MLLISVTWKKSCSKCPESRPTTLTWGGRGVYKNILTELVGAVIFSKNAENLILCQEVLARIVVSILAMIGTVAVNF